MEGRRITYRSSFGGVGRGLGDWALLCCHVGECSRAFHLGRLRKILEYPDRKASCTIESNSGSEPRLGASCLLAALSTRKMSRKAAESVFGEYEAVGLGHIEF